MSEVNANAVPLTKHDITMRKLKIAQHKNRPTTNDYIPLIFDNFIELHGDRGFADDKAILTGIAEFNGIPVSIIGQVKGRNTKEQIKTNWGMPHPEGYRKALRQMKQAEKFRRPVITFVDTLGAFCGVSAEERGQSEAIARNLYEMSILKTPVISVITTQGGSGGALGIALADKVLMLENANYSVISSRGFASLLWKDPSRENEAAVKQKMMAEDLLEMGIIDAIIGEPAEGAHKDLEMTALAIKTAIAVQLDKLIRMDADELLQSRYDKFRNMGIYQEI